MAPQLSARRALLGAALLGALSALSHGAAGGVPLLGLLTALVQAGWPLWHRQQVEEGDVVEMSFLADWRAELKDALWLGLLLLPLWSVAASQLMPIHVQASFDLSRLLKLGKFFVTEWLTVAAPEEWFWRGYVQAALVDDAPSRRSLGGPPTPWRSRLRTGAIVATALFALAHLGQKPAPMALATFVPGLLFAKIYSRRGRLLGASVLHAACNTASAAVFGLPP